MCVAAVEVAVHCRRRGGEHSVSVLRWPWSCCRLRQRPRGRAVDRAARSVSQRAAYVDVVGAFQIGGERDGAERGPVADFVSAHVGAGDRAAEHESASGIRRCGRCLSDRRRTRGAGPWSCCRLRQRPRGRPRCLYLVDCKRCPGCGHSRGLWPKNKFASRHFALDAILGASRCLTATRALIHRSWPQDAV